MTTASRRGRAMSLSEAKVRELVDQVKDPILDRGITIRNISIKEGYVGVKVALAKTGTSEQMNVQMDIVNKLKVAGAQSVGLRFEQLAEDELLPEDQKNLNPDISPLLAEESKTKFIAIASGKGGVGKSTVSANLAVALSRIGKKVGLIDADIYGFSIPPMMGLERRPEVIEGKIIPPERFGVKIMSMAFFSEDNSPVLWRGPMLGKMLNSFFTEVDWGELDYLLLDLPPGTGDIALDVHRLLPRSKEIIVTTPHETAAYVAIRAGKMALKSNHEIIGVIENMAYFHNQATGEKEYIFGKGGGDKLTCELNTSLLGRLPLAQPDEKGEAGSSSIFSIHHPVGSMYDEIAKKTIEKIETLQHV